MDWDSEEQEVINLDDKINELQSITQSEAKNVLQVAEEEVRDFLEGFSLTEDEAIEEEIDSLLSDMSSKSDISSRISGERQFKLEAALRKCMLLFAKQKVRNFASDAVAPPPSTSVVDEAKKVDSQPKRTGTSAADALMIQMLQRKVTTLKKSIELSDQKARSVNLQWVADKARYKELIDKNQQLQDELRTRLQIMEKKARKLEQLDRDSNMIKTQPSEIKELETVKETLANVESELSDKKQTIVSLSVELSDKKMELSTVETKLDALSRRLEELIKSEEQLHSQIENMERDGRNTMFRISDLQRDLTEAKIELDEEKQATQRYRDRLEQQQTEFDDKINGYKGKIDEMRQLVEKIMDEKESIVRENTIRVDALQRENGKLNQEKDLLTRSMKNLTVSLQNFAKDLQHLSTQMNQRDQKVSKRIETNVRSADYLQGEIKRLSSTFIELTSSSNSKMEDTKKSFQEQLDSTSSSLRMATARLELSESELEELRAKSAKAADEWIREKLKMQQDFDEATVTIQKQSEEIQKLKSGSNNISQEEVDELLESQKYVWQEKIAEMRKQSDVVINDLRECQEKLKIASEDNKEISRRNQELISFKNRLMVEFERSCMEKEDFYHQHARAVMVHEQSVQDYEQKISAITEQHEATLTELERVALELTTAKGTVTEKIVYATTAPEGGTAAEVVVFIPVEKADAGIQTDPMKAERERRHDDMQVIPGEEIVYGKIEALVKESLVTSNLYFSKESESFSNTYPIDENFLKDLVNSFVNMAQGIREMAKQVRAKDIESIVSAVAKDLIFKLDRARDESVLKIKAEQADVMAERIDETIIMMRRDKEAALYEQRESFERELVMAKSRTDKEIKRLEDMLSDQREMYRKELRKARDQWEKELEESDEHANLQSFPSQSDQDKTEEQENSAKPEEQVITTQQPENEEFNIRASLQGTLKRAKSTKRGSTVSGREVDMEIIKAQWRLEFEDAIRQEVRKEIELEINTREQQRKMHILKELGLDSDEVDKQIVELWKELPDKFKEMDLSQMKDELLNGSLSHIGDVRMENFDRLRNKGFGTADIIQLTIIEHHMRYDTPETNGDGTALTTQQSRQYKMQLKSMEIQRNMLLQKIVQQTNILDLLSYLHATDVHMQLLSTLNAWRSLLYYSAGGIFKDVLIVHMEVLEKCIRASGGLKMALSNLSFMSPDSQTDQWPQYFRVKALEMFRAQLLIEARDLKRSMGVALKFLQDKNTISMLHGAKLSHTLQDAASIDSTEVMKKMRDDHSKAIVQLRKSYHSVEKFLPEEIIEEINSAPEVMAADQSDATGHRIEFTRPVETSQQISSSRVDHSKTQDNRTVATTIDSSTSSGGSSFPLPETLKRSSSIVKVDPIHTKGDNNLSSNVDTSLLKSSSILKQKRVPSASRNAQIQSEAIASSKANTPLSGREAIKDGKHADNEKGSLQLVATPLPTKAAVATTAKHVAIQSNSIPPKVKIVEDVRDKKKNIAPDLSKLAYDSTFAYETSSNLNIQHENKGKASVVETIIAATPRLHTSIDQVLVAASEGNAQAQSALLAAHDFFQIWGKTDIASSSQVLKTLENTSCLPEVVQILQKDLTTGGLSTLAEEIKDKVQKFNKVMHNYRKNDKASRVSIADNSDGPKTTINESLITTKQILQQLPVEVHFTASAQMFDCATQTPVYKEASLVGPKAKSRRPDRSARNNEVVPTQGDRVDDDTRRKGLPPGFILANFRDDEFEIAPGLYLVKLSTLEQILRSQRADLNSEKSLQDLLQKVLSLPSNIFYCRGSLDSPEAQDLKSADYIVDLPTVEGCFPMLFPSIFPLQQGANLVCGFQYIGQGNEYIFSQLKFNRERNVTTNIVSLPHDLLLLQIADDLPLPYGIYPVQVSQKLILSDDRIAAGELQSNILEHVPPGHELVQFVGCAIEFPVGLEVAPGIKVASTPLNLVLPECVRLVKKEKSTPLPEFLMPIKFVSTEEEINPRPMLRSSCVIIEKPKEFFFDVGIELLYRPPGFSIPPGIILVPADEHPADFVLPPNHDLIQLMPLFELPAGARLTSAWCFAQRPHLLKLAPNHYLVHPDLTLDDHSVPPLPHYACIMPMPILPPGVVLPPRTKHIRLNISRVTPFPFPEGTIIAPGIVVVNPKNKLEGHICELRRPAINAIVVRKELGSSLPLGVQRGSRSDLPNGILLEENMEVVRVPVRFELPIGIKLDANVVLGPHVQLAPGTRLHSGIVQVGKRGAPYLTVVPWPHGVSLPRGTELVKRLPSNAPLPFEFQVVQHCDGYQFPPDVMVVKLPRKLHLQTLLEMSEQFVFGVESVMDSFHRALPVGMILVSRQSSHAQWPPELTPVHNQELPKKFLQMMEQRDKEAANNMLMDSNNAFKSTERSKRQGMQVRMNINIEVARLRGQIDFPAGVEIIQGVVTLSRPYWAMPIHNVVLVQLPEHDSDGALDRLKANGFHQVRLRSEVASNQYVVPPKTATSRGVSRSSVVPTPANAVDWSLPPRSIFVQLPEVFDVFSWRDILPGVESITNIEGANGLSLPPAHFLIQRPRHKITDELPFGFQLGISDEYKNMRILSLPPQIEIMHLVPVRYLPRGVNIINTSVLSKNTFNNMTGAMYMGLGGTTYTKKLFEPRWIPRMSPFEPISSKAVVLPWPENACRMDSVAGYFREANMLLFVRAQLSQRPGSANYDEPEIIEKSYPSNIIRQRESDVIVESLRQFIGDPQKDAFLLNVPTDFSQQTLDRGIPVCKIELVQISDGFPSPVDRLKAPQKNAHSQANMRHLAAMSEEATVYPRISRIKRFDYIDPVVELNKSLSELSVFFFDKTEKDAKRELDHLGFNFLDKGIEKLLLNIEKLKSNCTAAESQLKKEKAECQRLEMDIECLTQQVCDLQAALQTDDDLRAIIERFKALADEKEAENRRLKEMTTDVQERLQRQVDVLISQVAQNEEKSKAREANLIAQIKEQPPPTFDSSLMVGNILDVYGDVVASFVQDFVRYWCARFSEQTTNLEAVVIQSLQNAEDKRLKLMSHAKPLLEDKMKPFSPSQEKHPPIRLASSLEDEDANESVGFEESLAGRSSKAQSVSVSLPSHSISELVADPRGKPIAVSENFPLDVRSLYKTADMLPTADFVTFSKSIKPKTRKMLQSASLTALPPTNQMLSQTPSLASSTQTLEKGSKAGMFSRKMETAPVLPKLGNFAAVDVSTAEKPVDYTSLPDINELLNSVQEYFHFSTGLLKSRFKENPESFIAMIGTDVISYVRINSESYKKRTQDSCQVFLQQMSNQRDRSTVNLISALEFENQMLFYQLQSMNSKAPELQKDMGSLSLSPSLNDIHFKDDDLDNTSLERGAEVLDTLDNNSVSILDGKTRKMRLLEESIKKYELQLFKTGLSPIENFANQLQESHQLHQQLKLMHLLVRHKHYLVERAVDQKSKEKPSRQQLEPLEEENKASELKAAKFRLAKLAKQVAMLEERIKLVEGDVKKYSVSILDHVESYQRCVQNLLPPRMFHTFLTKSSQYYDKLRNLTQENLSSKNNLQQDGMFSLSTASISSTDSSIMTRPLLPAVSSSSARAQQNRESTERVVGGIGTMPISNSITHLRAKQRPITSNYQSAFRNAPSILPSLH